MKSGFARFRAQEGKLRRSYPVLWQLRAFHVLLFTVTGLVAVVVVGIIVPVRLDSVPKIDHWFLPAAAITVTVTIVWLFWSFRSLRMEQTGRYGGEPKLLVVVGFVILLSLPAFTLGTIILYRIGHLETTVEEAMYFKWLLKRYFKSVSEINDIAIIPYSRMLPDDSNDSNVQRRFLESFRDQGFGISPSGNILTLSLPSPLDSDDSERGIYLSSSLWLNVYSGRHYRLLREGLIEDSSEKFSERINIYKKKLTSLYHRNLFFCDLLDFVHISEKISNPPLNRFKFYEGYYENIFSLENISQHSKLLDIISDIDHENIDPVADYGALSKNFFENFCTQLARRVEISEGEFESTVIKHFQKSSSLSFELDGVENKLLNIVVEILSDHSPRNPDLFKKRLRDVKFWPITNYTTGFRNYISNFPNIIERNSKEIALSLENLNRIIEGNIGMYLDYGIEGFDKEFEYTNFVSFNAVTSWIFVIVILSYTYLVFRILPFTECVLSSVAGLSVLSLVLAVDGGEVGISSAVMAGATIVLGLILSIAAIRERIMLFQRLMSLVFFLSLPWAAIVLCIYTLPMVIPYIYELINHHKAPDNLAVLAFAFLFLVVAHVYLWAIRQLAVKPR